MWSRRNHAPVLFLEIDGKPADDVLPYVKSFVHKQSVEKAAETTWSFNNGDRRLAADPRFFANVPWRFRFGYYDDLSPIITAIVREIEPVYAADCTLQVTLYDSSIGLTKHSAGKNWGTVTTSTIAKRIAQRYGMQAVVEDSKDRPAKAYVQPASVNDLQYLRDLAAEIDFEVYVEGTPPRLIYRKKDYDAAPQRTLTYFDDPTEFASVLSFSPRIKGLGPVSSGVSKTNAAKGSSEQQQGSGNSTALGAAQNSFAVRVDGRTGTSTVSRVAGGAGVSTGVSSGTDARKVAAAKREQLLDKANEASSKHPLTASFVLGKPYLWDGLDGTMNRLWYTKEITCSIDATSCSTEVEWKRNATAKGDTKSKQANNKDASGTSASKAPVVVVNGRTGSSYVFPGGL